jgi:hypothetical protein
MKNLIQANELRVGNLYDNNGVFKKASPNTIEEVWEAPRSWCKPIPLTEEWLLKLGFKQCGYEMLSWKHETLLPSFDLGGINWADFDEPDYQFLTYKVGDEILRIDYVHQLQNLYFALTGEELKQQEQ